MKTKTGSSTDVSGEHSCQKLMARMMRMPGIRLGIIGATLASTLLLVAFMAGCSKDRRSVAGSCDCDTTAPRVSGLSPVCGVTGVVLNQKITVLFNKAMDSSTITAARFTLAGPGGAAVSGTVSYVKSSYIATFTPGSALASNTSYTYTVKGGANGVRCTAGNELAADFVCSFTTGSVPDNSPPTVSFTDPINHATDVALNKIITATFSEVMDPSTITTATFTLKQGTTPITGAVTYTGTTATFRPAGNLTANTIYTATITTGTKDLAEIPLAANYVWSFTTGVGPDVTAPTVTSTDPANLATNVDLNKIITAAFSEGMDPSTITTATFTLMRGTTPIAGTIIYSGTTATFRPATNLTASATFTGTITTGARDLAGNALAANYVWSFTTGVGPDVTAPTVTSTDPANLAMNVDLNKIITAAFSEGMDPSTITTGTFTLKQGTTPIAGAVTYSGTTATFRPAVNLTASTTYTGTISAGARDLAGNALAANYVWSFTTGVGPDVTAPTVSSTDPANHATNVDLNKIITATFSEGMDPSTITTATFTLKQGTTPIAGAVTYSGTTATFRPSGNLNASTIYTGTITTGARDLAGNALAANYVWSFTTGVGPDLTAPTVTSTDPANLATNVDLNKIITAAFSEGMDRSTITTATFTLKQGTTPIAGTVTYSGTTATFRPTSSLASSTTYTGTITTGARDLAGNALAANYVWSFTTGVGPDVTAPTVSSTDPANHATNVDLNKIITATFSEGMDPSTISTATFTLKQGTTPIAGAVTYSGTTATFRPSGNLIASTTYTGTITTGTEDLAGNALAANYVWSFTTGTGPDVTAPTVSSTDPANHATHVDLNKIITATFSEGMDPSTISTATFTLKQGTTAIAGAVTYSGTTATFRPSGDLTASTTYTGTITTGAEDLAGNALAANYVWSFTTGVGPDVTAPTVISTDPASLATNVDLNKIITATFSEGMDRLTITTGTFTLKQGTTPIAGTVTYSGITATFRPATNLTANTTYTGTITTGARDLAGNALAANYVWSFTTGAGPDVTAPTVISTDPANLATNVDLNKIITATFSEGMDPLTITTATFTLKQGTTPITGTVNYAGSGAVFAPASDLTANMVYTATITTGARDLAGNALAVNYVWSFTTGDAPAPAGPPTVNLDCASSFVVLAGATVTNTGGTIVDGNLGLSPGSAVTGFPPGQVINGATHINDALANNAKLCLTTAYNDAAGRSLNVIVVADGELGGKTLAPGLYKSAPGSFGITSSDLTLDAQGDVNAVWIFQMPSSTLTVGNGRSVILAGGAQAKNIFWQVGSSATIGTTASMKGNILADQSITMQTGATIVGRLLTRIAAVTLAANNVTKP